MPPDLPAHGRELDNLSLYIHVVMALLFVGWGAFFLWTLVRFRASRNPRGDYTGVRSHISSYVEAGVAFVEVVLLFGLSVPLWSSWINTDDQENPLELRVIAQQFAWNVQYPGPDGKLGPLKVSLIDEQLSPIGLDTEDPAGQDDIVQVNHLVVPAGRPVRIYVTTKDVIHSFFLPVMRVKQDAIPGQSVPVGFVATTTSKDYREALSLVEPFPKMSDIRLFEIACAQLCGGQHFKMRGYFHIVPADEFDALSKDAGSMYAWVAKTLSEAPQ
jgi:cytochrome c oxidase subunit 2